MNRPIVGVAATQVSPAQTTPRVGSMVICAAEADIAATYVSTSVNGVTPIPLVGGKPTCKAGIASAIAVALTVKPSRRTEYPDAASPSTSAARPKSNGNGGPLEATPGSGSMNSPERRRRTRNAESSAVRSDPVPPTGHGFGTSSSTPGHSLIAFGGRGEVSLGLKSVRA